MTGGDPNKAEIEVSLVGDGPGGDAAALMQELAKATDAAAKAEERYQRELQKRNRVLSGLARQRVTEERRAATERRQEERRQEMETRRAEREQARRYRDDELAVVAIAREAARDSQLAQRRREREYALSDEGVAARRIARLEQDRRVKERMAEQGYGDDGEISTSPLKSAGREIASSLGVMTTRAAAIAAVVQAGRGVLATEAGLARDPYMQRDVAQVQTFRRYVPVLGDMTSDAFDLGTDRGKMVGRDRLMLDEKAARQPLRAAQWRTQQNTDIDRDTAADLASNSLRLNPMPATPGGPRGSVGERHRYEETARLYQVEQRIVAARREQYSVSRKLYSTDAAMAAERERLAEFEGERASLQRSKKQLDENSVLSAADKEATGRRIAEQMVLKEQRIAESRQALLDYTQQRQRLDLQNRQATGAIREAESGRTAARLEMYQQREQVAASQAARLALAGPEGRLRAQYAGDWVSKYGLSNAPDDIRADYQAYFSESAQSRAVEEGQRYVQDVRPYARDEYRDDVTDVRAKVDKLKTEQQAENEKNAQSILDAISDAMKGVGSALAEVLKKMEDDAWQKKLAEETARAFSQGR